MSNREYESGQDADWGDVADSDRAANRISGTASRADWEESGQDSDLAAYSAGYTAGKEKAHQEIRDRAQEGNHADDCMCEPCITVRVVYKAAMDTIHALSLGRSAND